MCPSTMVRRSSWTRVQALRKWMMFIVLVVLPTFACSSLTAQARAMDDDAKSELQSKGVILNALTFGVGVNVSLDGCEWRRGQSGQLCPDPAIKFYLYTSYGSPRRTLNPEGGANALMAAGWVQQHHTVVLIHGYGGGDNTIPISILRDAYLRRGDFNVIMVDWGALAPVPCYPAAVHNSAHVGRCVAAIPKMLRDAGAATDAWTCVGHSLGAHVCGTMSDYLSFRVHKIIGLDPARPLVRPTLRYRLDPSDAAVVHVLHTDGGHYGEVGRMGTVDFCVNGGRTQPHCRFSIAGEHVCNHVSAVCFLADSLEPGSALMAEQCSARRCPAVRLRAGVGSSNLAAETARVAGPIPMGHYSPDSASGTYCTTSHHQPYCPRKPGDRGHPKCCVGGLNAEDNTVTPTPVSDKFRPGSEPEPVDAPGFIGPPEPSPTIQPTPPPTESGRANKPDIPAPTTLVVPSDMEMRPRFEPSTTEVPADTLPPSTISTLQPTPSPSTPSVSSPAINLLGDTDGLVLVLPSTEITTPATASSPKAKEAVFPVYSTVAETSTGRILVVMATPLNTSFSVAPIMTQTTVAPPTSPPSADRTHFMPFSPSARPFSHSFFPTSRPPTSMAASTSDQVFFMTEMLPPKPTPLHEGGPQRPPALVPMQESAPATAPGAPEAGDAPIPMAGSLTGPWVPMVMLPPTPFSTDSWKIRGTAVKMPPVRRSTYRNYIYD